MILKRLAIDRLPGISEPFEIKAAGQGFHVIFGPNGIGKSSICRAVEALYWEDRGTSRQTSITGEFEWEGECWRGEREGAFVRWRRGDAGNASPNLPPSHQYRCFFLHLRDLIDTSPASASDIASAIRRQMSGGFDLDEIASNQFPPVTHQRIRRERNRFNDALAHVQKAEVDQFRLQARVDELEGLNSQLERADIANGRLVHVERAIGLAQRREELHGIDQRLEALPTALSKLTGKESDDIEHHRQRLSTLETRFRELERQLQAAREEQAKTALSAPLGPADLATWQNSADELGRVEQALEAARGEQDKARTRLASALHALGGASIENASLSLPDHGELFEFLRASHSHETRVSAIEERLRLLEGFDPPEQDERDLEEYRAAADALRAWLRMPEPESVAIRLRRRWPWLLSALALLSTGAGLALFIDPSLAPIAALGAGVGLAALFLGNGRSSNRKGPPAPATFAELGFDTPTRWDSPSVTSALRTLEGKTAELEASLKQARAREVERNSLASRKAGLKEAEKVLENRRQELQSRLGLEQLSPDAELVDFVRALDHFRLTRGEHEAARGKARGLEVKRTAILTELADVMERYGETRPENAASAKVRMNNLAERNSRLLTAVDSDRTARNLLTENTDDRGSATESIRRIYAEAGLDDGDWSALSTLLESLPHYRDLNSRKNGLQSQIELDRSELEKAGESRLVDRDSQALELLKANLSDIASQARQLRDDIADVSARMEQAQRGNDVQNLIAAREAARASLRSLRDEALLAGAGNFLLDDVEGEYEHIRMPRVFERARDHFSGFTFHGYDLRLKKGKGTPSLFARDTVQEQDRELHELSDGTRAQLLLAARVAFAEEVEQGNVLPLFLDEALDQSDPQRFDAIVRSLGRLAQEQGRQIFYLSSDPLDVNRIRNALDRDNLKIAAAIDLGLLRADKVSAGGPGELQVDPAPAVPAPGDMSAPEYGAALNVPRFRPVLGAAEQHMFYVLWDDLELLRDLLENGIVRAGQWNIVSGTPLSERLGERSIAAAEIGLRLDLLETFCELWKQGRGRPVDFDALNDSGALTARFLDDVVAIAKELDGDPERLLAMLASREDDRLRGFQRRTHERLLNYLLEHEYIDERPILSAAELRLHALATPAANALPDGVAIDCIHQWWGWAESSAVESAEQAR